MAKKKEAAPKNQVNVLDQGFVRLVDHMGNDSAIVQAARVSYGKGTKKVSEDEGLIRYLLRHAHTTPFEMVQFKFHIKAPIFVFRQWHRHRMWSYNEYSGRYSEMKDEFYVPAENMITKQNPTNKQGGTNELIEPWMGDGDHGADSWSGQFSDQQKAARGGYERWLKTGVRKELARINLPLSQYSEMYGSVDLHNLFHFLKLRLDSHAQYEIRVYADALYELIKPIVPIACQAFEEYRLNNLSLFDKDVAALNSLFKSTLRSKSKSKESLNKAIEKTAEKFFTNSREKTEFIQKAKKIFTR